MSRCTRDCGALCSPAPVSTTASAYLLRCERQSTHRSAIQKSWEPSSWTGWAGPARKTIICSEDELAVPVLGGHCSQVMRAKQPPVFQFRKTAEAAERRLIHC
ncbi:uncharacterized protein LOC144121932 isoform X1 [Amblyomma americanum]